MQTDDLLKGLLRVERLARATRWKRFMAHPGHYLRAMGIRHLVYPLSRQAVRERAQTFFGAHMGLPLPASMDIYLCGGKTHDSEIRLARFLIRHLQRGDTFIDVGAHLGYFSLLAAKVVGREGQVWAFEAAPTTSAMLRDNLRPFPQGQALQRVVSDRSEPVAFYEFPTLYSEYNSLDLAQYQDAPWLVRYAPRRIEVRAITLGSFIQQRSLHPRLIKIDVEGAEDKVIAGMEDLLKTQAPGIILECWADPERNANHRAAIRHLRFLEYRAHRIESTGELSAVGDAEDPTQLIEGDSDNLVFTR